MSAPGPVGTSRAGARERILDAALEVIGTDGLVALTNRRVASAAGVSLGSLTYHFASQTDLLREALERFVAVEVERIEAAAGELDAAPAAFAVGHVVETLSTRAQQIAQYEVYLAAARDPALQDVAARCFAAYDALAARLLERLGIPPERAPAAVAIVDGAALRRLAAGEASSAPGVAEALLMLRD